MLGTEIFRRWIMSAELSPVAIADDGEFEDVRRLLDKLGVDFVNGRLEAPETLLRISNPRNACEQDVGAGNNPGQHSPFHIVILDEDSQSLRHELKSGGFDFIVQRPVHPAALRLLILHALYSGPERRSKARVAMDAEVKLKSGLLPRAAMLRQLSEKGCGLVSEKAVDVGNQTTVVFPRKLMGSSSLSLEGRVVASVPLDDDPSESHEISIVFRPPKTEVRERLVSLMASQGVGSASLRPKLTRPSTRSPATFQAPPQTDSSSSDRRRSIRKNYRRPVLASAKGAVHTIIGRDLSTTGMRVAADARLSRGDEFKLVIYGSAGRTPLMVKAEVVRNDGPAGCALRFRDVGTSAAASLEEMVELLPQVAGAQVAPNLVVSEIVQDG